MNDPNHPVWSMARLSLLLIAMTLVLYFNASQFDSTEVKAIIQMFLVAVGLEGGVKAVKSLMKGKDE